MVFIAPAVALANPPAGYNTTIIYATQVDTQGVSVPIRNGYYDSSDGSGWGFDKANTKHNIGDPRAVQFVLKTPNKVQGRSSVTYNYTAYAIETTCTSSGCTVTQSIPVIAVASTFDYNPGVKYMGAEVGGTMGLRTAYCSQAGGEELCPGWVTTALYNGYQSGGIPSGRSNSAGPSKVPSIGATTYYSASYDQPVS